MTGKIMTAFWLFVNFMAMCVKHIRDKVNIFHQYFDCYYRRGGGSSVL